MQPHQAFHAFFLRKLKEIPFVLRIFWGLLVLITAIHPTPPTPPPPPKKTTPKPNPKTSSLILIFIHVPKGYTTNEKGHVFIRLWIPPVTLAPAGHDIISQR